MPRARHPRLANPAAPANGHDESPPPVAVIDIGASAARLVVAELKPGGRPRVLEEASRGILLGKDTFSTGRIGPTTIEAAVRALEGFQRIADEYGASIARAVATSAVREAANAETFLDRVRVRTGLQIEIIDGSEESRLTYLAVRDGLGDHPALAADHALLVEVGGGSADLTRLERMQPTRSGIYPLGAIRLRQHLASWHGRHEQRVQILARQIANVVAEIERDMPLGDATELIALGSDIRFAAERLADTEHERARTVSRDALLDFCAELVMHDEEELVERFRVSQVDAETLVPALLVYSALLRATAATRVIVPASSLRAGLLAELSGAAADTGLPDAAAQVRASAASLGEKYRYDAPHAHAVAGLAARLFDALAPEHALAAHDRLLLEVAALLHDIGLFVGLRGHHKHSLYLLESAEVFGLSRDDMAIVASVARYHRRGLPDKSHASYAALGRDDRVRVNKLGAILRLANALDAEHLQKVAGIHARIEEGTCLVQVDGTGDLTMECLVATARADMLADVLGRRVVVRGRE